MVIAIASTITTTTPTKSVTPVIAISGVLALAGRTAGRALPGDRRDPPWPELDGGECRGAAGAHPQIHGERAGRLGDRRQLREQAWRPRARRRGQDRLARPAAAGLAAAALAAHGHANPRPGRALGRQSRELARRLLGPRLSVRLDASLVAPPPPSVAAEVRGRPTCRAAALGGRRSPLARAAGVGSQPWPRRRRLTGLITPATTMPTGCLRPSRSPC